MENQKALTALLIFTIEGEKSFVRSSSEEVLPFLNNGSSAPFNINVGTILTFDDGKAEVIKIETHLSEKAPSTYGIVYNRIGEAFPESITITYTLKKV